MSKIQVLSDILASQVAAGEVVERPASVVRELVDNALDAGATKIEVVLHQGGQSLIRVSDNGSGMSADDMHMSIQRHATSKIAEVEDLHDIQTRGFRGEALPSMLSVSRFKLASKDQEKQQDELGHELIIEGGELVKESPAMIPQGTIIEVKDLFYNVPARRKFLKSQGAESGQVDKILRQLALSAPYVHFIFKRDGKLIFDWPAVTKYQERIAQSIGGLLAESLISLEQTDSDAEISLQAAFLPPSFATKTRKQQQFFVNARPVENAMLSYVLRDALDSVEWRRQFPLAWIYLTIKPNQVDVNVHPAKKEIRFSNEAQVRSFVLRALSQAWQQWQIEQHAAQAPTTELNPDGYRVVERVAEDSTPVQLTPSPFPSPPQLAENPPISYNSNQDLSQQEVPAPAIDTQALGELKHSSSQDNFKELFNVTEQDSAEQGFTPLALLDNQYLLVQNQQSLSVIHAKFAQERIIYEQLMPQEAQQTELPSQQLLLPELIELSVEDKALWQENQTSFEQAGFEIESFGVQTVQLCAVPMCFSLSHAHELFLQMLNNLSQWQSKQHTQQVPWQEFCLKMTKVATHGWKLEFSQSQSFIERLLQTAQPYQSPTGKLIWKTFRPQDLERFFQG